MRHAFPLFQSHLDVAHTYWTRLVQPGDLVIDATCGNGHDTLKLCQLALTCDKGKVYAFDIQSAAIEATRHYLMPSLTPKQGERVHLQQRCHATFPEEIEAQSVKLIVYNLGYLPGGDKTRTTQVDTTLNSVQQAQTLLQPGGMISITCYPGHLEGAREQHMLLEEIVHLCPKEWSCSHQTWLNRTKGPSLLVLQRACSLEQMHSGLSPRRCGNNESNDPHH